MEDLKARRLQYGLTLEQVAKASGVNRARISAIENSKNIHSQTRFRFLEALDAAKEGRVAASAGRIAPAKQKIREPIDNKDGTWSVPLTKGKFATIDDVDRELVSVCNWAFNDGYAYGFHPVHGRVYMHRLIMNFPTDMTVDHLDRNRINNRRRNLRVCTLAENNKNRGKYRLKTVAALALIKEIGTGAHDYDLLKAGEIGRRLIALRDGEV